MNKEALEQLKVYAENLTLLYVEDDEAIQRAMIDFLQSLVPNLEYASNGQEGLDKVESGKIDIIFTDIRMPVKDGIKMIREIKGKNYSPKIYVISAHDDSEYLMELINLKVDGFIPKPTNMEHLFQTLFEASKETYDKNELDFLREKQKEQIAQSLENSIRTNELKGLNKVLSSLCSKKQELEKNAKLVVDFLEEKLSAEVAVKISDEIYGAEFDFDSSVSQESGETKIYLDILDLEMDETLASQIKILSSVLEILRVQC